MKNKNYQVYYNMQSTLDGLYEKSKSNINFNNLMDIISSQENILLAFRMIKANTGSKTAGCDGITINDYKLMKQDEFVEHIQENIKNYVPNTVRRVFIPKKNGKLRPLGIPTIKDRIIQQAILQVLEPICEAKFYQHSYGFRPNRSTQHAVARLSSLINISQLTYVVDMDIKSFFDNVNHKKLRQQIWKLGIHDKQLLAIISKMLKAPIEGEGIPNKGTPQGGILSPLLANIVLNDLDWWVSNQWETFKTQKQYSRNDSKYAWLRKNSNLKEGYIVRYADDFKIICPDYETAKRWFHGTKQWLSENLKLEISEEKSRITDLKIKSSEFLGFSIKAIQKGGHEGRDKGKLKYFCVTQISRENIERIVDTIRNKVKLIQKTGTRKSVWDLNVYIMGVHEYYKIATQVNLNFQEISYRVSKIMYNRFKDMAQAQQISCSKCHFVIGRYSNSNSRTYIINKQAIVPIAFVQFNRPLLFSQQICDYTKEGREKNEVRLLNANMQECVTYLSKHFIPNRSIEYNDNRISLFSAHKGKCYLTGMDMTTDIHEYHCHHKIPICLGGTDEYKNLVPLCKAAHILVHATREETILEYRSCITTNEQLKRLNNLRKNMGLKKID